MSPSKPTLFPDNSFAAYFSAKHYERESLDLYPHYHQGFELLYILEGSTKVRILDKWHTGSAGDLLIYYPLTTHEERIQPGTYRIICIRFPIDYIQGKVSFPELTPVFALPWKEQFQGLFDQLMAETKKNDSWSRMMINSCLIQFVVLLHRALESFSKDLPDKSSHDSFRIQNILETINQSINKNLSLKDLAQKAFLSESRFSHVFKDITGTSPKNYIISTRLEKSCDLLASSNLSIIKICQELGYENPAYFSRLFKSKFGTSPTQFRKNSKKV